MAPQHRLAIQMFGSLEVRIDGSVLTRTRSRTERHLLALLTLQNGSAMSRDLAGALLWPDSTSSQRLGNLRRSLVNLRHVLESEGKRLSLGAGDLIFDLDGAFVDVLEFDRLVTGAEPEGLKRGISIYRGALLAEWDTEWAVAERLARISACAAAIQKLVQCLPPAEAIHYLRHAVAIDPTGQWALRELMSLLAKSGDPQGALDAYHSHDLKLRRQFGWGVPPETTALFDRIRTAGQQLPGASPKQTGESPDATSRLMGREVELQALHAALHSSRLVTLTGPPGVGKTRLAYELVQVARHEFREGLLHVPMQDGGVATDLFEILCQLWTLDGAAGPATAVRNFLSGREVLVWIDGIEHLTARFCEEVAQIRQAGPGVHCLLTSWQATDLPGEKHIAIGPLQTSKEGESAEVASESALFFEDRARRVSPTFSLTSSNLAEVESLCRELEGLPLAVEIAAAWISTLTLKNICETFVRFGAIGEPLERVIPNRRRSLRAALDSSIEGLTGAERRILHTISAFPDGCTADAILSVTELEIGSLAPVLHGVVAKSLVVFEPMRGRYRMLKVIRDHCLARLSDADKEMAWLAAGDYMWKLVSEGLSDGDTLFDDYADRWLLSERENFRFFTEWWRNRDMTRSVTSEFAMVAYQVWQPPDVRTWMARFSQPEEFPPQTEPFVRYMIGIFAVWQRHPQCRDLLDTAVATARAANLPLWEAASFTGLSVLAQNDGNYSETARLEREVQRAATDAGLVYYAEHSRGIQAAYECLGGDGEAMTRLWDQLHRGNLENDWRIRYASLRALAFVAFSKKDYDALSSWSRELVAIGREHSPHELTHIIRWQIIAAIECGDFASAREWGEQSIAISLERKSHDREAGTRLLLADLAEHQQNVPEAERQLILAGQIYESISDYRQFSICLIRRAGLAEQNKQREEFVRLVRWAKALADTKGFLFSEPYSGILSGMLNRS